VQEPNVHIERCPITRVTAEGIETADGVQHALDAIVCATGFNTSFSARYDILGREAMNLKQLWQSTAPEAYMGLAVSGFPNYFGQHLESLRVWIMILTFTQLFWVQIVPLPMALLFHALNRGKMGKIAKGRSMLTLA
jgi:cation diffusion facilitator CzcD-associated flavoprotein CzcO